MPDLLLKKHCLGSGKDEHIDGRIPRECLKGDAPLFVSEYQLAEAQRKEKEKRWLNQFAESAAAQEREYENRRHFQSKFGSRILF